MSKVLYVGDPHARVEELDDCQALVDFAFGRAVNGKGENKPVERVVFLGDQHHNHAVVRIEVMAFWKRAFEQFLTAGIPVLALVGNHDQVTEGGDAKTSAMLAYDGGVLVVDHPVVFDNILHVPYIHDQEAFVAACKAHPTKVVVCHQTFNGSLYDNGMYAPGGIEPDAIPQEQVISGHIHLEQEFGKIWYPGTARWMSRSDANARKGIWLVEHAEDGTAVDRQFISSSGMGLRKILHYEETPDSLVTFEQSPGTGCRVYLDIKGPSAWIETRKAAWAGSGAIIRTVSADGPRTTVKESEGITTALQKFIASYKAKHGTPAEVLAKMVQERVAQ